MLRNHTKVILYVNVMMMTMMMKTMKKKMINLYLWFN